MSILFSFSMSKEKLKDAINASKGQVNSLEKLKVLWFLCLEKTLHVQKFVNSTDFSSTSKDQIDNIQQALQFGLMKSNWLLRAAR